MTIRGLRISIFPSDRISPGKRRWIGVVDLDHAAQIAVEWARAENRNPTVTDPFTRYTIVQAGSGTTLPTILRSGTVDA